MRELKVAVAQFEPHDGDKNYNLSVMDSLTYQAKKKGAEVISFHEMCITAYTHTSKLTKQEIFGLAESVPDGESTKELIAISARYGMPILAGLIEKDETKVYNTYICVNSKGLIAKYRKLHPFINKHLAAGNEYVVFDLLGWKCGILICYDNNVIENVRATVLSGAEIIFAPHVTGCTPSAMPGRGYVSDELWTNRVKDPVPLRMEFEGPKGRDWLLRWLPARAYDNGVYYLFTNPIGYDGIHLKNGNSMVLDPYGEVQEEIRSFNDEVAVTKITDDKLKKSGGWRYRMARRPELYKEILGKNNVSKTKPVWLNNDQPD